MYTKIFQSGNNQAIWIPIDLQFDVDTVEIFLIDNGDIVLRPIHQKNR